MRLAVVLLTLTGMALPALPLLMSTETLVVYNGSNSMPKGFYRVVSKSVKKGDIVLVRLSGALLIKRLSAEEGDVVCREGFRVTINGRVVVKALRYDGRGKVLPVWQGCRVLKVDEAFVLGEHRKSFDGRYFGVVQREDIIGQGISIPLN